MTFDIVVLTILIILSGFFSSIETALMSISNVKARQLFEKKKKGSKHLKLLKDDPHRLIVTLLLGNNLVNIGASALATSVAIDLFGSYGVGIATGGMTLLILVFGEICPKGIAINNAEKISLKFSPLIYLLKQILMPFVLVLDKVTKFITNMFAPRNNEEPLVTEEELRDIVMIGAKEGSINTHEKTMIDNIFELNDTTVEEIMTPRTDMFAVNANSQIQSVIDDVLKNGHTRIPVFEKSMDNVTGTIHVANLFEAVNKNKTHKKIKSIRNQVRYVPETKKIDELIREFQTNKEQIAIVIDEFGGVSGLVTMEDIIEEIVGEIYDEGEKIEYPITKKGANEWIVVGNADIEDVEKKTKIKFNASENVNTVGGYIMEMLGKIPKKGEKFAIDGFEIKVENVNRRRVKLVRLVKN
ncbi:MAG: hemolysin family protein [Candidatus Woesearchaeota archaeon]